jgi:hypothetical protein
MEISMNDFHANLPALAESQDRLFLLRHHFFTVLIEYHLKESMTVKITQRYISGRNKFQKQKAIFKKYAFS